VWYLDCVVLIHVLFLSMFMHQRSIAYVW